MTLLRVMLTLMVIEISSYSFKHTSKNIRNYFTRTQHYLNSANANQCTPSFLYIDFINIQDWAVFPNATLTLSSKPSFIVLTGESGSGKSTLIKAIKYSTSTGSQLAKSFCRSNANCIVTVEMGENEETSDPVARKTNFKRSFNPLTNKVFIENNGKKTTAKATSEYLENVIRFWSDNLDSLSIPDLFRKNYIDIIARRSERYQSLLVEIQQLHQTWTLATVNLRRLENLRDKMSLRNELDLIIFFSEELSKFEFKVCKYINSVNDMLLTLDETNLFCRSSSASEKAVKNLKDEVNMGTRPMSAHMPNQISTVLQLLQQCIEGSFEKTVNLNHAWDALDKVEKLMLVLLRVSALDQKAFNAVSGSGSGGTIRTIEKGAGAGVSQEKKLLVMISDMLEFKAHIEKLQENFHSFGFDKTSADQELDEIIVAVTAASKSIKNAQSLYSALQKALPDCSNLLDRLKVLRGEWDMLSRKHNVAPQDLQQLKKKWAVDQMSMQSMETEYPSVVKLERDSWRRYARAGAQLLSRFYPTKRT